MESSDQKEHPQWMTEPFGPGWEEVGQHVDTIVDIWSSANWQGGAVSEHTPAQLASIAEAVNRAEEFMRQSWSPESWTAHQEAMESRAVSPTSPLTDRIAYFEYRLVQAWQAQQVHAYWAQLSPEERASQQAQISEYLTGLPPSSLPQ